MDNAMLGHFPAEADEAVLILGNSQVSISADGITATVKERKTEMLSLKVDKRVNQPCKVYLNGNDITDHCCGYEINSRYGNAVANLELMFDEVEINEDNPELTFHLHV